MQKPVGGTLGVLRKRADEPMPPPETPPPEYMLCWGEVDDRLVWGGPRGPHSPHGRQLCGEPHVPQSRPPAAWLGPRPPPFAPPALCVSREVQEIQEEVRSRQTMAKRLAGVIADEAADRD